MEALRAAKMSLSLPKTTPRTSQKTSDVPRVIERTMMDRYIAATGQGDKFERAYWTLAAQRNTRIIGVFTRLWKRDNKPHYTAFQPRMWGLLERDLEAPALAPVKAWFDRNILPEHRAAPWADAA